MKLGIVCFSSVGGSGIIATEVGQALARRGHEIHFIGPGKPWRFDATGGNVFHHTSFDGLALDLVHAHYATPHAAQAMRSGYPYVVTLHGTDVTRGEPSAETLEAVKHATAVTVPSRFLQTEARRVYGREDIQVIANFVNTGRFIPGKPERVLMHASNFRPIKRIADVIKIFRAVKTPCELVMVGDGPDRTHEPGVTFLGQRHDVARLLQRARVFLLPSESESFGVAALEAQSAGVPVVGSAVGGVPEVVRDGETGFLRAVGDVAAMAECAQRLLDDDKLHQRMSAQARDHAVRHFSEAAAVDRYEQLLTSI